MCDCVERVEEKILNDVFLKDMEGVAIDPKCHFENMFFGGSFPLYSPVRVEYLQRNKTGKEVNRYKTYTMTFEYCPFCGEKIQRS